jgi:hypothetical protein
LLGDCAQNDREKQSEKRLAGSLTQSTEFGDGSGESGVILVAKKGASYWKALGMIKQACMLVLIGKASDAVQMLVSGINAYRSTGSTLWAPSFLSYLARAYVVVGQFDDAWRCISEALAAVETTKEKWCEADIHRTAGEIALMTPEPDAAKAQRWSARRRTLPPASRRWPSREPSSSLRPHGA